MSLTNITAPGAAPSLKDNPLWYRGRRSEWIWVSLAVLALILTVSAGYVNWVRVARANATAMEMRNALGVLRQILISLEDAETGQRGYLLTGDKDYLEPYLTAAAKIDGQLDELNHRWPVPDDYDHVAQFGRVVRSKMAELKTTIQLANSSGVNAALAVVKTDRGKLYMDQARVLAASLEREVSTTIEARSASVTDRARDAGLISAAASLTLFLLLMFANIRLRRQREIADAANRAKSEFLASMSHELRTPLNAIIGYSEMLVEEAEDSQQTPLASDLVKIQTAGHHLLMLINSILDLSKIEAGRMDLYLETIAVHALIDDVISVVRPLADRNRNTIEANVAPDVGSMHTDQTKVRQALYNLLSNACKFTENGKITFKAHREIHNDQENVVFVVRDTGVGMTEEEINRVFEAFTQADASTSRRFGGTGLGLTLSRRFVLMLSGEITVKSQPNFGSEFTVRLPANAADNSAAPQRTLAADASRPTGDLVLIIDDEPAAHDLLKRTLVKHGFHVESAHNGQDGLRLARKLRPSVITLDVMMPGMDGWSVLTALKADPQLCDIPVVMLTIVDTENMGYALGATDYLTKPLDRERLLSILARYRASATSPSALIVEDDESSRLVLRRALEGEGWKVEDAGNGRAALDSINRMRPGIIVLDLMMPEMDGFEFLEQLRKRDGGKTIPVVVVTARDLSSEDRDRLNGHVSRVLTKGAFQIQDMLAEVSQLVLTRVRAQGQRPLA